jgi:hypothetical protein
MLNVELRKRGQDVILPYLKFNFTFAKCTCVASCYLLYKPL